MAADQRFEQLFAATVAERGKPYQEARDAILSEGRGVIEELQVHQASSNWRVSLQGEILLGWLTNRALYVQCLEVLDGKLPGTPRNITGKFTLEEHIAAVVELGPDVSPCLMETMLKRRPLLAEVRARAMGALRVLRHRFLKEELLSLLHDDTPDIQMSAASTLSLYPDPEVTHALLALLRDPHQPEVARASAARALGKHPVDQSAVALHETVADTSAPNKVRYASLEAIVELKDKSAVPVIIDAAKQTKDDQLLVECIAALGNLGDPSAVPFVRATKSHPVELVREEAEMALDNLTAR